MNTLKDHDNTITHWEMYQYQSEPFKDYDSTL